jgi:hypothetical protein
VTNVLAQFDAGVCYGDGEGVKQDEAAKAFHWYLKQGRGNSILGTSIWVYGASGMRRDFFFVIWYLYWDCTPFGLELELKFDYSSLSLSL